MERRAINPWTWQDQFGYVQANEASGAERVLVCSGAELAQAGCRPASTLLGVARLAYPSLMVEIEATAVR